MTPQTIFKSKAVFIIKYISALHIIGHINLNVLGLQYTLFMYFLPNFFLQKFCKFYYNSINPGNFKGHSIIMEKIVFLFIEFSPRSNEGHSQILLLSILNDILAKTMYIFFLL